MGSNFIWITTVISLTLWSTTTAVDDHHNFVRVEKTTGERVISVRFGSISALEITASDGPQIDIIIRQVGILFHGCDGSNRRLIMVMRC